jgi:hypothetical protein
MNGKFVLGQGTTDAWSPTLTGSTALTLTDTAGRNLGMRKLNPFVFGFVTETPYIPGLAGAAEVCGVTTLSSTSPAMAPMLANAPGWAKGAMMLMDKGPAGLAQNWDGFDMLLLVNLTNESLSKPRLGVGQEGYLLSALAGGFQYDPAFGGSGHYALLGELPAEGVYATLVPEGTTHFNFAFGKGADPWVSVASMTYDQAVYAVPEPGTLLLLATGALALLKRRKRPA